MKAVDTFFEHFTRPIDHIDTIATLSGLAVAAETEIFQNVSVPVSFGIGVGSTVMLNMALRAFQNR